MWLSGLWLILVVVFLAAAARDGMACRERLKFLGLALLAAFAYLLSLSLWHP